MFIRPTIRSARAFFFQAEDGIRGATVTGVQTCALPISLLADPVLRVGDLDSNCHRVLLARFERLGLRELELLRAELLHVGDPRQIEIAEEAVGSGGEIGRASCRGGVGGWAGPGGVRK